KEKRRQDETVQETAQGTAEQAPNLDTQIPKGPRSKRTSGEYVPSVMGYTEDT
ncbi:hypothetical protein KI387_031627, partial [Taxus chinensis]